MGIHKDKLLTVFTIFENTPCTNPRQSGVPSLIRLLSVCSRKPESSLFDNFKALCIVENSRVFAFLCAFITSYTDVFKVGQFDLHILHLLVKSFLDAEDIKFMEFDKVGDCLLSIIPQVPHIRRCFQTYIKRSYRKLLCR